MSPVKHRSESAWIRGRLTPGSIGTKSSGGHVLFFGAFFFLACVWIFFFPFCGNSEAVSDGTMSQIQPREVRSLSKKPSASGWHRKSGQEVHRSVTTSRTSARFCCLFSIQTYIFVPYRSDFCRNSTVRYQMNCAFFFFISAANLLPGFNFMFKGSKEYSADWRAEGNQLWHQDSKICWMDEVWMDPVSQ